MMRWRPRSIAAAQMITVAVRRVNITDRSQPSLLDFIDLKQVLYPAEHGRLLHGRRSRADGPAGPRGRLADGSRSK